MKVLGLAGWKNAGKTTLMVNLVTRLTARGLRVSTVKHAHHEFDIDQPGKDSHRHRQAGATEVVVTSAKRWALLHELRGAPEADLASLLKRMSPVDLVLVEGFKGGDHDKLEIHRAELDRPLMARSDPHIVAVASDVALDDLRIPVLPLNEPDRLVDFIVAHCGLETVR